MKLANNYNYEQAIRLIREGKYALTKKGILRNVRTGREIGTLGTHGYWQAGLYCNVKRETYQVLIHRLNYCYHKGMVAPDVEIDHRDDDRSNRSLSNLQPLSHQGNVTKMVVRGRQRSARGEAHSSATVSDATAMKIRKLWARTQLSVEEVADRLNVSTHIAKRCISGKRFIYGKQLHSLVTTRRLFSYAQKRTRTVT